MILLLASLLTLSFLWIIRNRLPQAMLRTLTTVIVVSMFVGAAVPVFASGPLDTQTSLNDLRFSGDGNYALASAGTGLLGTAAATETTFGLNVPGTVVAAYLYWSGFSDGAGDNAITFSNNTITQSNNFTALAEYSDFWFDDFTHYGYVTDVTALVRTGTNTYGISNLEFTGNGAQTDGTGLIVVYEDAGIPFNRTIIRDGQSIFFPATFGNPSTQFKHSATSCVPFDAYPAARNMSYTIFAGGVEDNRDNALWTYTDAGAVPSTPIVSVVNPNEENDGSILNFADAQATGATNPGAGGDPRPNAASPVFDSNQGNQWDIITGNLTIAANNTFACYQIQTFEQSNLVNGASGAWLALGASIPLDPPPTDPPPTDPPPTDPPPTTEVPPTDPPSTPVPPTDVPTSDVPGFPPQLPVLGLPQTGYAPVVESAAPNTFASGLALMLSGLFVLAGAAFIINRNH